MIIRREALHAALAATAEDTRYYLNAVQLEPAAHRVVATNGHVLLIVTDHSPFPDADFPSIAGAEFHGDPAGAILAGADIVRAILSATPKKTSIPILTCAQLGANGTEQSATLAATDLQAPRVATLTNEMDGRQFPQYERAIPKADRPGVRVTLAVDVLEQLIKAAKAIKPGARSHPMITFDVPTEEQHIDKADHRTVTAALGITMKGDAITVTGAAMPCRL